ncbi:hypothetical protein EFP49_06395 [Lactobacillus johnsonii]|jgi:hypothetical protein|uniref:Lipoprotein n=2 Tax=Lactobacillaceae TaxID=33958 RepID=A0A9W3SMJ7_LACJH|nr:hypothetical protein [Lactobacillus johnsonii]AOG26365.1 hypothetical protein BBP16_05880 [Lactobacillus johnsonii]MCT3342420.1 hypothetical protein [Lactobacillus johnsonii]MCT3385128.1 hypothetical protein [Lactobacillus johnsonii]QIA88289.1 hypothetical protein FEE39_08705 [Lactobacillus johnsonii]QXL47560.1 hypothetical protein IGB12_09580 [Lactobacillus johnsonii]
MMKKIISIGLVGLLTCTMLTACSNSQNNTSSSSTEKTTTVKKSSKITANNLTTKKQTAITIAYAGEKYPDIWKKTFKQAQNNSVVVKLHNRKDFSYMQNGSDVAYEIATVDGDKYFYYTKNDPTIFFYHKNKEIGSSDIKMMIKYLNNHNDGSKVNKIIKNIKVVDERKTASKD